MRASNAIKNKEAEFCQTTLTIPKGHQPIGDRPIGDRPKNRKERKDPPKIPGKGPVPIKLPRKDPDKKNQKKRKARSAKRKVAKNLSLDLPEWGLGKLLADLYTLRIKTQKIRWNLAANEKADAGHLLGRQDEVLDVEVDKLGSRMGELGLEVPGSLVEFEELTRIRELAHRSVRPKSIRDLARGHRKVARLADRLLDPAKSRGDMRTWSILLRCRGFHAKSAVLLDHFAFGA